MTEMHLAHLPHCRVDQLAGNADSSRQSRQITYIKPLRVLDFDLVRAQLARFELRKERDHQGVRERPWLAREVASVTHAYPDLFHHLAFQTLLDRLARLHETRQSAVHSARETRR